MIPAKCITPQQAKNLQNSWITTRQVAIERAIGRTDTREFFFTVAELEEFLDYIKSNSQDEDPGVRIYLGAYNTVTNGYATLFMAPTRGEDQDYENDYTLMPLNMASGRIPPLNYNPNSIPGINDDN
jgi:hypothetical protein